MKRLILLLLVVTSAAGLVLVGCDRTSDEEASVPTIIVATDATWPPMEFVNENKEIVGFDIDLINAVAEAGGFEVEIRNSSWEGIFAGLETEEYDAAISSITITEERKETLDFSTPYINAGQVLVVPQSVSGVTTLQDLVGETVGAQISTTGAFEVQKVNGVKLATYDEIGLAVADLANGRIAGVVLDTPVAADYVLQNDEYKGTLKIVGEPFTEEYYGIAVKKGNSEVLDLINKGLADVLASDLPDELANKWLR